MLIEYKFTSQDGREIEGLRTELDRNYDDEELALVFIHNDESDAGGYFELNIRKDEQGRFTGGGYMAEYDSVDDSEPSYINADIELTVTEHDFDETLRKANETLEPFGKRIVVDYDGEMYWSVGSVDKDGSNHDCYADGDFEHEVGADINECLVHVLARVKDPELCQPPKTVTVWVVTFIHDREWELPDVDVEVFGSEDEARKRLDEEWKALTEDEEYQWQEDVSQKNDDNFLFEDHCANRVIGEIRKREVIIKQQ